MTFAEALSPHTWDGPFLYLVGGVSVIAVNDGALSIFFWRSRRPKSREPNPALNLAPFGRWTLRDKAAQRR